MQRRTRTAVTVALALAAVAAVAFAVSLSLNPDNYFFYRPEDRAQWVYYPGSVAFVCSAMLVEAFVAWVALVASRPRSLWLRCVLGLAVLGPWALISSMLVVHMPAYTLFHHLWVWVLVILLVVVAFASAARLLYLRFRGEPLTTRPSRRRFAARLNSIVRHQKKDVMNWGKIAKYTVALLVAQVVIGFVEASVAPTSVKVLLASSLASFLAGAAIFARLSYRQGHRPFAHAWSVLILQVILGTALLLALVGSSRVSFPPFALLEFIVLVGALVAGTTVGSYLRRGAGHPAGA